MSFFEIYKSDLLKGLSLIQGITGRRTTLPILSHIFMEWKENALFLTATDLETGIREKLKAEVHEEGKASVSAKKLYEIVRELPEGMIQIRTRENHWINLTCEKSIFNLVGLDPEEFPSLPSFQEKLFSFIPGHTLKEMIDKTVFAASNEESRYHIHGILFIQQKIDGRDGLRLVATDGHRLSLIDRECPPIKGIEKGVLLPKKGVLEIKKVLGEMEEDKDVGIYFNQTHGFFKIDSSIVVLRLIEGEYPDYEQVIPKDNDKIIKIEKEGFNGSLRRIATMASERLEGIKLSFKRNLLELTSYHQDFGDAKEELEVLYEGPPLEVGFNARYLLDALQVMDTPFIIMELKDEGSPCTLRPETSKLPSDQLCIVMPMRI